MVRVIVASCANFKLIHERHLLHKPIVDINFIVGQRVRVLKNMATGLGIYQGALGTVNSFVFDDTKPRLSDQEMFPRKRIAAHKLSTNGSRQGNLPVIMVQMDKVLGNISCDPGVPNLIPFTQVAHMRDLEHGGRSYHRSQYPLVPAQATTLHRAQGLTAHYGAVLRPQQYPGT